MVSGQLEPGDIADLAAAGVRRIVNTRPDGEKPDQLPAAEAARLATERGIDYRHVPVTMQTLSANAVHAFGDAIRGGSPVHAHCGSGLRVATLWGLDAIMTGRLSREDARRQVAEAGFDLTAGLAWLDAQDGGSAA
jgi:sulfide:quinone oxidoreductase